MKKILFALLAVTTCGLAFGELRENLSQRDVRDPRRLEAILNAGNAYVNSSLDAITDGTGDVAVSNLTVGANATVGGTLGVTGVLTATGGVTGNASTATTLATARTLWGRSFDGSANVDGALTGVTDITASGDVAASNLTVSTAATIGGVEYADVVTTVNGLITYLADGLWTIATLANSDTPNKFKTTTTTAYSIGGITYTKTAADDLTFAQADTINAGGATNTFYGGWAIQVTSAGVVSTLAETAQSDPVDMVYESAAAALVAAKAITPTASNAVLGYLVLAYDATAEGDEGGTWTANTDDLTTNATATWTDGDVKVLPTSL